MSNKALVKKFLVTAHLDGEAVSAFSLEALNDAERACDRFLDWFLVRRSAWFAEITPEDVDGIKESKRKVDVNDKTDAEYMFHVDLKGRALTIAFFPVKFII